jgi:hypothetical protein
MDLHIDIFSTFAANEKNISENDLESSRKCSNFVGGNEMRI